MPLVLINPQITGVGETIMGPEGCLSFPEIYADVPRSEAVLVKAQGREGHLLAFRAGGLLGRAIQHEVDHLNGILFIDRITSTTRGELRSELEELQARTRDELKRK
jgi:peptide deformylase